jgi:hypothetical protein
LPLSSLSCIITGKEMKEKIQPNIESAKSTIIPESSEVKEFNHLVDDWVQNNLL